MKREDLRCVASCAQVQYIRLARRLCLTSGYESSNQFLWAILIGQESYVPNGEAFRDEVVQKNSTRGVASRCRSHVSCSACWACWSSSPSRHTLRHSPFGRRSSRRCFARFLSNLVILPRFCSWSGARRTASKAKNAATLTARSRKIPLTKRPAARFSPCRAHNVLVTSDCSQAAIAEAVTDWFGGMNIYDALNAVVV
jgi:hypothetical protein